jgi:hypothetical protein
MWLRENNLEVSMPPSKYVPKNKFKKREVIFAKPLIVPSLTHTTA